MKGTLYKTEQGWIVQFQVINSIRSLPLHPQSVQELSIKSDKKLEDRIGDIVEFEKKTRVLDENGYTYNYAKLIDLNKETEWEFRSRIINEVWDEDEPQDYLEDLAKGEVGWYDINDERDVKTFIAGYNKAKETLFTEEQVKQAINRAVLLTLSDKSCYSDEIIQSLKQPKK